MCHNDNDNNNDNNNNDNNNNDNNNDDDDIDDDCCHITQSTKSLANSLMSCRVITTNRH